MSKSLRAAWILFGIASTGFYLCVMVAVIMALSACSPSEPDLAPDVSGTWAGNFEYSGHSFLVMEWIRQDGTRRDSLAMDGAPVSANVGTWMVSGNQFIGVDNQCQESDDSGKLVLVACSPVPDSTLIDIQGNAWTQSGIISGHVLTLQLVRIGK